MLVFLPEYGLCLFPYVGLDTVSEGGVYGPVQCLLKFPDAGFVHIVILVLHVYQSLQASQEEHLKAIVVMGCLRWFWSAQMSVFEILLGVRHYSPIRP